MVVWHRPAIVGGVLLAIPLPARLGDSLVAAEWRACLSDRAELGGAEDSVEEAVLARPARRMEDVARLGPPKGNIPSDTIGGTAIRSDEKSADVTVQVPIPIEPGRVLDKPQRSTTTWPRGGGVVA